MRLKLLAAAGLFLLGAGVARADEKPGTPGGPPPGKGKNKFVAPAAKPAPPEPPAAKPMKPVPPAPATTDGIGPKVSALARSGVHGRQLADAIHKMQAASTARQTENPPAPSPGVKPSKPAKKGDSPAPTPGKPGKGKGGGEE